MQRNPSPLRLAGEARLQQIRFPSCGLVLSIVIGVVGELMGRPAILLQTGERGAESLI